MGDFFCQNSIYAAQLENYLRKKGVYGSIRTKTGAKIKLLPVLVYNGKGYWEYRYDVEYLQSISPRFRTWREHLSQQTNRFTVKDRLGLVLETDCLQELLDELQKHIKGV
jgi:hypothetical protein